MSAPNLISGNNMPQGDIKQIAAPKYPHIRFEWHVAKRRIYVVSIGKVPEIAEIVSEGIDQPGSAQMAVLIWLRGYQMREMFAPPALIGQKK